MFIARAKIDADYATDTVTRILRTGFITNYNCASTSWFSKKQNSVESSILISEFIFMKTCCECIRLFRHRLQMMGMTYEGPICTFGNNRYVLHSTTMPDSNFKKKS